LSVYEGFGQSVKISLPLDRTVFQQNASNSATFQLAGQVKYYFSSGATNAVPEYQIESLNKTGGLISIQQSWTNTGINYSTTSGFFNKTITLSTGWYRITVRYDPFSLGYTNSIKVGVGEVIFAAGQSNAQGVAINGNVKGGIPVGANYDCIMAVNERGWCKNRDNYKFPFFDKMVYSNTDADGDKKVAPNGYQSLWCYQELGQKIVDRKSTNNVTTPVAFFNAGASSSSVDNWKESSANLTITSTETPFGFSNCDSNPIFDNQGDGPEGYPYRGLKNALNYYGGMLGSRGVIWHQGESETILKIVNSPAAADYKNKLEFVILRSREHFSNDLSWAISRVSRTEYNSVIRTDDNVKITQTDVKNSGISSQTTWGAYYSDQITDRIIAADDKNTHFNKDGLIKLAQLYDTGTFVGNPGDNTGSGVKGGDILSLTPVVFNNRQSLAVNVTRPNTGEITMAVSGVYSAYYWVSNEGKITDSPTNRRTQSITVNNTGTDRWRCYVLDSKGNVAITQEVALPVQQAIILGPSCPSGTFTPLSDKITCDEISGWVFRSNSNGEFGAVDIYVDGQYKNRVSANSTKQYGMFPSDEGYIYNVPTSASWRDGVDHVISVRRCNYTTDFASNLVNCPASTDITITDKTGLTDVSASGGAGSFVVNSTNANWNTGGTSWATVSPTSGSNGGTAVSVTFQANSGPARNVTLNVVDVNAGILRTVDISQLGTGGGLPACNCGFTLLSATQNTGQYTGQYTFNSCNASSHKWQLLSGTTEIANNGISAYTVNSSTVPITIPSTVNTGSYTLKVDAANCTGSSSLPFSYTKPGGGGNTLSLSQNTWLPSSTVSSQNVTVTSNISWSASTDSPTWLTVSPGSGSITLSATANGSTSPRTGIITVSGAGVTSQTVTVTQAGSGGGLTCPIITTANCGNASEGYTHTFNITQAGDYKFKITYASGESNATGSITVDSDPSIQFSVGPSTGSWTPSSEVYVGTVQKTFTTTGNHTVRIAGVNGVSGSTFAYNKLCPEYTTGGGSTLSLSQNTWLPSATVSSQNVTVTSNISWSASTDSPTWLTVTSGSGSITLSAIANGTTSSRTGIITVSGAGVTSQTVTVTQAGSGGGGSVCSNISTVSCGNASEGYTHTLNITQAGNYKFKITYASGESNATGTIIVDSDPAIQFQVGSSTGSWNPSVTVLVGSVQKYLSVGNHNVRIAGVSGVSGSNFAHNSLCAVDAATNRIAVITETEESFEVYPNPTNGKIKIGFSLQQDENVWLNLYDSQGRSLQIRDFEGKYGRNLIEIDLQDYPSGAYFINLQSSQKREVQKVMKVN
jgi:hypothetical protein